MDQNNIEKDFFSPKNLWEIFRKNIAWFAVSVIGCLGLGCLYIVTREPVFERSAQILIKDDSDASPLSSSDFGGIDLFNQASNIYNEISILQSPDLMKKVVERLDLNNTYVLKGKLHKKSLYGDSIPFKVVAPEITDGFSFRVEVKDNGTVELSKFRLKGKRVSGDNVEGKMGQILKTPVGNVKLVATPNFAEREKPFVVSYSHMDPYECALVYDKLISITNQSSKSNIIALSIKDVSIKRGNDILRTLIDVYNESWKADKNQIAESTTKFITDRLLSIEQELGNVDTDISHFKSSNLLPDLSSVSDIYMKRANEANAKILEISNKLYMAKFVRDHIANIAPNQTLPTNSGFENQALAQQISQYNNLVLERNNLASVSSETNPIVRDMDASIRDLRGSIISAINNQIVSLETELRAQKNYEGEAVGHIASNPEQAKYLISVERQQKVKESLYLFLLQKLEENELTQTYSVFNNRVVVEPGGTAIPVAPRKKIILLAAFLFGLCIPYGYFFLRDKMITTISSREDLAGITVPSLGDIPLNVDNKKKSFLQKLLNKKEEEPDNKIVVERGSRNVLNESFRLLRTNLEMITGRNSSHNVITITSFNPGSGKSFITMNLAATLAFKGKKVIVVDCDMRHGSSSEYVGKPSKGLVDYLSGSDNNPDTLIQHYPGATDLDVLPIGQIPPNPTELLENGRMENLLATLRSEYDYVLIDCPPIDIVADTHIVEQLADRTIFIVRAGLLDRGRVPELQTLYTDKRLKNMTLVLNGVTMTGSRYYNDGKNSHYYINS